VLHQHLFDLFDANVGIDRAAADLLEQIEGGNKALILPALFLDPLDQRARQFGNALLKLLDGGVELRDLLAGVAEKLVQQRHKLAALG